METVHLTSQLSKEVFNVSQKFTSRMSKPQQGNFRELVRGMIITGSVYLSDIAKANDGTNNVRKDVERLSNTLSKIQPLPCTQLHINSQVSSYRDEPVLILSDGGDFQKPYAMKMEKVCGNVDGSHGHKPGRGYSLHGLMAYGLDSHRITPLACQLFSTKEETYKGDFTEQKKVFNMLTSFIQSSEHDRIVVEDRGCDDEKRFLYFLEDLHCSFLTRVHTGTTSRHLIIKDEDGNDRVSNVQHLCADLRSKATGEKEWYNAKTKKHCTSTIAYQEVFLPSRPELPLHIILVYTEEYNDPLVVLTDLAPKNAEHAWKYFFYYKKRWEVENFYRAIKQNFSAESFLILGFNKIQALAFLLMFVYSIILDIKEKTAEFFGSIYCLFTAFCKKEQRTGTHQLDILAFLRAHLTSFVHDQHSFRFWSRHISGYRSLFNKFQLQLFPL